MTAVPKRHWFRFRLRTLFVVLTVAGAWSGWQVYKVQQRRAFRSQAIWAGNPGWDFSPLRTIPFYRRWLGDELVLHLSVGSERDKKIAEDLFPEAVVWIAPGPMFELSRPSESKSNN
jgi:hypothetical protein